MRGHCAIALLLLQSLPLAAQSDKPLSLADAETLALYQSGDLRIQDLKNEEAAERGRLAIRDYLPQLQVGFTTDNEINVGAPDSNADQLSLTFQQPIYNGGRTALQHSLNDLELLLSRRSYLSAREDLLAAVWQEFYKVLVLQAQIDVKRSSLAESQKELAIAESEQKVGMTREIDLIDAELAESNQEVDVQQTQSNLDAAAYALKKTVGLPPDNALTLAGTIDASYQGLTIDPPASYFVSIAAEHNLDLATDRFKEEQAEAKARIADSQNLPQVAAIIGFTVSGQQLPLQTPGITLGLNISFPGPESPIQTSLSESVAGPLSSSQGSTFGVSPIQSSESSVGPLSMTQNASTTGTPFQSVTGYLDRADARFELEQARQTTKGLLEDITFAIAQQISQYHLQQTTIGLERRSVDLEKKKLAILEKELAEGAATSVDYIKEQTSAADLQTQLFSDILTLIQEETALEKLIGLEPGGLAALLDAHHDAR